MTVPIVLTVGGSDSSGGAGIQADIRTIHALEGYATSVVTAVTSQNTHEVSQVFGIPPATIESQLSAVCGDLPPRAMKTGMLWSEQTIEAVVRAIRKYSKIGRAHV